MLGLLWIYWVGVIVLILFVVVLVVDYVLLLFVEVGYDVFIVVWDRDG